MSTATNTLNETVARVSTIVNHYHRDAPFRAPESVPEFQARMLNNVWSVLSEAAPDALRADRLADRVEALTKALGRLVDTVDHDEPDVAKVSAAVDEACAVLGRERDV